MARRLVLLALCATAAVLGACGGGDSTSTSSTSTSASENSAPVAVDALGASVTASTAGEHGLVVQSVQDERIRLQVGDVIIALDGDPVGSPEDMIKELGDPGVGDSFTIEVVRGDKHFTLTEVASPTAYLGAKIKDGKGGVAVVDVEPDGPADQAGVEPGDLITALDGVTAKDSDALLGELAKHSPDDRIDLVVERGGDDVTLTIMLGEHP